MYIYLIENLINNKCYVGITRGTIKNRWRLHKKSVRANSNQTIHNAIRKYGAENFSIKELDICATIDELYEKEKYWICELDTKNNGYNETDGGEGTHGLVLSEERKENLRVKAIERFSDPKKRKEHSDLMKRWHKNHPITEETREKLKDRPVRNGWKHTEETKQLMRDNSVGKNKGIVRSEETKQLMRDNSANNKTRTIVYMDGTEQIYKSLTEASKNIGVPLASLKYMVANNKSSAKHGIKEIITK